MLVVIVHAHVKPELVEDFKLATLDNAINSIKEAGIARFDVYQQRDDPTRFSLIEVYRSEDGPASHRATSHYVRWRDTVEVMMAEPRARVTYNNIFPADSEW
jgi:(4S)-4-hydroxy-5-phosphonooxypentane-2,3-dione isomerase